MINVPSSYAVGGKEFNYTWQELVIPVMLAFNKQMRSGLDLPLGNKEMMIKMKKVCYDDPVDVWYAPQGSKAEALVASLEDKIQVRGEDRFWELEDGQNRYYKCSLFCSSYAWVTLGNTCDVAIHVVHVPTRRTWTIPTDLFKEVR